MKNPAYIVYLTVSSTTPSAGSSGTAVNIVIKVDFDRQLKPSSLTASTFLVNDGTNSIAGTISTSGKSAVFTPSGGLKAGTKYIITITTGVEDAQGNSLKTDYIFAFITAAAIDTSDRDDDSSTGCFISAAE